jgi:putative transposase
MVSTVTVVRTVVSPLETSEKKNEYVRPVIEEYQSALSYFADMIVSYDRDQWEPQSTPMNNLAQKWETDVMMARERYDAVYKVVEAFSSKVSNGHDGDFPSFGNGDYVRIDSSSCGDGKRCYIEENDRGYGLYVRLQPYTDGEWFHMKGGEYQYSAFDEIVNGDASLGNVELHLDDGELTAHVSYSKEVEVPDPEESAHFVGVDVGENVIYATAVRSRSGEVKEVEMETGEEQRHHRDRLVKKQERRQRSGVKQRAAGVSDRQRYTEQVMHTASRRIVDLASEYTPATIVLEDLTGYRQSASNPIHDWPYGMLHEQIAYKADAAGVSVKKVNPEYTSKECRKCGTVSERNRDGVHFECTNCGYTIHADVNAAMNIAERGLKVVERS